MKSIPMDKYNSRVSLSLRNGWRHSSEVNIGDPTEVLQRRENQRQQRLTFAQRLGAKFARLRLALEDHEQRRQHLTLSAKPALTNPLLADARRRAALAQRSSQRIRLSTDETEATASQPPPSRRDANEERRSERATRAFLEWLLDARRKMARWNNRPDGTNPPVSNADFEQRQIQAVKDGALVAAVQGLKLEEPNSLIAVDAEQRLFRHYLGDKAVQEGSA